jgi:signal transduction histidine kinase
MLDLAIACVRALDVEEENLKSLAHTVALERIEANANIGDFVYNVTIGRSEIFAHLTKLRLPMDELNSVFQNINLLFDKFLYFSVHHYSDVKSQQLLDKSSFIEQSHKDKMTILGQMSSSFVHEFRNPLTSVIGFVQLLQQKYPELEYIDVMSKELNELKFRINQFLLVSKKGDDHREKTCFQLAASVDETLEFLYPMIVSANVDINLDVEELTYVRGYPDEFRQVLINILMNSLDALSACLAKMISIRGFQKGGHLVLEIANNGPPIPKEMIATIFEPFVSSKELGTGIGLYVCRKIIMSHGGIIECESNHEYTTFRITVPVAS